MRVILIGAGNIGRRHLEGVLASRRATSLLVIDPDPAALAQAKALAADQKIEIDLAQGLDGASGSADLVIDATCAEGRRARIETLLDRVSTHNLVLEKVVFQNTHDFAAIEMLAREKAIDVRVNFPRRLFDVYRGVADEIAAIRAAKPGCLLSMTVTGGGWSLCCNGTHFLDLYLYLSGGTLDQYASKFEDDVVESKRSGAIELFGSIYARGRGGSVVLSCDKDVAPVRIDLTFGENRIVVEEGKTITRSSGLGWNTVTNPIPFVSQTTAQVVIALANGEPSKLPALAEACLSHVPVLDVVARHLIANGMGSTKDVPIT